MADGGPGQVIQPHERLVLNGMKSRDDKGIVSYKWKMLTEYLYAVYEVRRVTNLSLLISAITVLIPPAVSLKKT